MSEETKQPTKEEFIEFLKEQIEVLEYRAKVQELNTKIAEGRAKELQSLAFIAQITSPKKEDSGAAVEHVVTEEDMENNPELKEYGVNVGDTISLPSKDALNKPQEPAKKRELKKDK